jgi:DNA processing protein
MPAHLPARGIRPTGSGVTVERMFAGAEVRSNLREQATVLAMTEACPGPWHELASLIEEAGSASAVIGGEHTFYDAREDEMAKILAERTTDKMVENWAGVIERTLADERTKLVTVLDEGYPANLRRIYNRPPFLFVRGEVTEADARSVAVVGTRKASAKGRELAREMAAALAEREVTVISGLAAGIDSEAHEAALDAGGRTIAVMGTGIDGVYPKGNEALAERIEEHGALLSQFWPGSPPKSTNFPIRNAVTSGMAIGTVVVEASSTSGAKMQARLALEHGKRLFLVRSLVMQEEWAHRYASRRGAVVVDGVDDVVKVLESERSAATELQLF